MIEINPIAMMVGAVIGVAIAKAVTYRTQRRLDVRMLFYTDVLDESMAELKKLAPYAYDMHMHVTHNYPPQTWDRIMQCRPVTELTTAMYEGKRAQSGQELIDAADDAARQMGIRKLDQS